VPNKLAKAFGKALQETRQKREMSLLDLAVSSDMDKSYIWELEHGRKRASLETVFRLAEALQLGAAELVKLTAKHLE
jgi:transcriptional regulator with XRE-family HTH domain